MPAIYLLSSCELPLLNAEMCIRDRGYTLKKNEIEAMSQEALLAEIQEERTKELAFEAIPLQRSCETTKILGIRTR